ncbi:MAG: hypothetical protein SLAVMIC_00988 [uncultured marine phage]|uniref:Uncharacterized protein n=1 Tax=uncultured marine phage TaxID=707152 RepID=A0A8D9FS01_9VIRU|nr:MAG: hypothetical protein SLAVMIC_00988 [uncultured marine phage]
MEMKYKIGDRVVDTNGKKCIIDCASGQLNIFGDLMYGVFPLEKHTHDLMIYLKEDHLKLDTQYYRELNLGKLLDNNEKFNKGI